MNSWKMCLPGWCCAAHFLAVSSPPPINSTSGVSVSAWGSSSFPQSCGYSRQLCADLLTSWRWNMFSPTFRPVQLSPIHHVLWCKPIDFAFFGDLILDRLQAAWVPSSCYLSFVSRNPMGCNCMNSLSHNPGMESGRSGQEWTCLAR